MGFPATPDPFCLTSDVRDRRGICAALGAALLAATLLAGCGGSASTPAASGRPGSKAGHELVTAGPDTGDLFLTGVVSRDGRPVRGAKVTVSLSPEDLDIPVGSSFRTWDTPLITTAADGAFAVHIDASRLPSKYLSPTSQLLNFDLQAILDDQFALWSSTLWRTRPGGTWRTDGASTGDSVARLDLDFGHSPTVVLTDSTGEQEKHDLPVGKVNK